PGRSNGPPRRRRPCTTLRPCRRSIAGGRCGTSSIRTIRTDLMSKTAARGRAGVIGFIVAETSLFAVFVIAYLFYIGKSQTGPFPEGGAGAASPRTVLPSVQQRDGRAGISRARRGPRRASRRVAVRHHRARRGVPGRHGAGVASADRRPRPHHRHESIRHDVLPARGAPRFARDPRARHAEPLRHLRVLGRTQGRSRGTRRARLVVLALRGRRVGRGLHRRVRGRTMKPAVDVIVAAVPRDRSQVIRDLVALGKPRVLLMVLASTLAGYFVALDGPADFARVIHVLIGTFMAAAGTLALNQYV